MNITEKYNNYYLYFILFFIFLPLNLIDQHFDGILILYAFETNSIDLVYEWYRQAGRYLHQIPIYIVELINNFTQIDYEVILDNLIIFFLILFCLEIKKYSYIFFNLEEKWCNLAALFVSIFPIWHIFVSFDIGQYIISTYFLLFGFRYYIKKNKFKFIFGLILILYSFNVESNLSFAVGLSLIYLLAKKSDYNFLLIRLFVIIGIVISYYFVRMHYFPPYDLYEGYNTLHVGILNNISPSKIITNIIQYSSYLYLFMWIPIFFIIHVSIKNKTSIKKILKKSEINYFNYFLLIILAGFAIFPYIISDKSSSIFYLSDYYQRHAILLAPISGIFFSMMFKDLSKLNYTSNKISVNYYISIFIVINLILLNYGNVRKAESNLFRKNIISEFKAFGEIPKGNIKIISQNLPVDLRDYEINYLLFNAYGEAGWYANNDLSGPKDFYNSKEIYRHLFIFNDYEPKCNIKIILKNDLTKIERLKYLYLLNYKNFYNIDSVDKNC